MKRLRQSGGTLASAEIGRNGLRFDLAFAQGGEIVGDGFFFIKADLAGVGANESLIENAAGKLAKVFFLQSAKHTRADFRGAGDGFESNATLFPLPA